MKKRMLSLTAGALFVAIAVFNLCHFKNKSDTELSELALANIEALASDESYGGITEECFKSYVVVTECCVTCVCGTVWYPTPRVFKASAINVKGRCNVCGFTFL